MSDSNQQSESLVPKTPLQDVQPPEIRITTVSSEGNSGVAEQTIPEASTALPGTVGADAQNSESAVPTSPTHPIETVEGPMPKSGKPSTDPPLKSLLHSFTEPTTAKPSDGTVPAAVDPKTGVTKPHENFTPQQNLGLVGQAAKSKFRKIFCCGGRNDSHS